MEALFKSFFEFVLVSFGVGEVLEHRKALDWFGAAGFLGGFDRLCVMVVFLVMM